MLGNDAEPRKRILPLRGMQKTQPRILTLLWVILRQARADKLPVAHSVDFAFSGRVSLPVNPYKAQQELRPTSRMQTGSYCPTICPPIRKSTSGQALLGSYRELPLR